MGLQDALTDLINRHSAENTSNTPDYILAQFLIGCLDAFNTGVQKRETWYGRDARPTFDIAPLEQKEAVKNT